jgi:transcription antitermination factor NusA-like protein
MSSWYEEPKWILGLVTISTTIWGGISLIKKRMELSFDKTKLASLEDRVIKNTNRIAKAEVKIESTQKDLNKTVQGLGEIFGKDGERYKQVTNELRQEIKEMRRETTQLYKLISDKLK